MYEGGTELRTRRIQEIEQYILENQTVTLDQICEEFHISMSTLRRDLGDLLQNNSIHKIYGGVTTQQPSRRELVPFGERHIVNPDIKRRIAVRAASLVHDGDVIFVDSGTTTLYLADTLAEKQDITVLTNNLAFICRAMDSENMRIISLSGTLNRKTYSFTGPATARVLENYNVSKAFLATTGFSSRNGVTNSSPSESDAKRAAVSRSETVCLLADHSKFGSASLVTFCGFDDIDILITDQTPPQELVSTLTGAGVRILLAD